MLPDISYVAQTLRKYSSAIRIDSNDRRYHTSLVGSCDRWLTRGSFEIAGRREYEIWDVILVKQFTGFCIGLLCTALLRSSFFDSRLLKLGLIGAVAYIVTMAAYLVASSEKNIATRLDNPQFVGCPAHPAIRRLVRR